MSNLNIRNIPTDLMVKFKSLVILNGETMRSAVLRMLAEETKRLEKRRGK